MHLNCSRISRLLTLAVVLVAAPLAAQQTYTLTGQVVDATTQRPLPSVQVVLSGTSAGALTNSEGRYSIVARVTPDTYTVAYTLIGRGQASQTVTLGAESAVLLPVVALQETAVQLQEVVVTGTGAPTQRRALGNAVATVSGEAVAEAPGAVTVGEALQGKVAGAHIVSNSGVPGGSMSIRLRGTSSIVGGAEPLYIIDGVIVDNSSDQPGGINFGSRSNPSSRLSDLNPNDIERIEVLKGAAAAALYGSRANNGVVQIFTRRGRIGEPQITASTSMTLGWRPSSLPFNMAPTNVAGEPVERFDNESLIYRDAVGTETYLSLSGGAESTRYYLSAGYTNQEGIMKASDLERINVRLNLDQTVGGWLTLSGGANYITSSASLVNNGEQGFGGLLTAVVFTPTTVDFSAFDPETGHYVVRGTTLPNPLEVIDDWSAPQDVSRFVGSFQASAAPIAGANLQYRLGYDTYGMDTRLFIPRGTPANPDGSVQSGLHDQYLINNDLVGNLDLNPVEGLALTTTLGMNHTYSRDENVNASVADISLFTELLRGTVPAVSQNRFETATLGYFVQEQVGWRDRLFLTGALRWDASSTFGANERWQLYPKLSGSWVISDEPFWAGGPASWINSFRLRAALGYAGNQPPVGSAYARFSLYTQESNAGRLGLVHEGQAGNPDLRPERQREYEVGFDASLLQDRLGVAFTYYDQYVTDLLLARPFAPSTGYDNILANVGELSNHGVELQLTSVNIDRPVLGWQTTLNYAANRNEVTELLGNPFQEGYRNRVEEGQPLGVWYLYDFERDEAGQPVFTDAGLPVRAAQRTILGEADPRFSGSLLNTFRVGNRLNARVLLDGAFGHEMWNQTQRIMDIVGAGPTSEREARGEVPPGYTSALTSVEGFYLEDASYVKLREVSLTYALDEDVVPFVGDGTVELEVAGRNLVTWSDYSGYDPEVNMFGTATVARGTDFAVYPNPRQLSFGIRVNY